MAKKQIDYQQILNDFVADIDTNPKLTDDKLFQAYPELNNDKKMLDAAWSYYNTLKANKYDEATLQSKFPEFFGDENTAEVTESSSAEKENNSYWKSIGANNPYPLTQEDKQEMEREKAVKREDAAELPLSQRDRERETEIRRLRTEGTWGKPNGYSFGYDKEAKSPVLTYTKGDGVHLSVSATPSNKDEIDKLESERPSYVTREIKTPEDIYTSVSEAWSSNTEEGRKAKKEMDESSLRIKMLIEDDIDKQVARLQQQVANGSLSEDEAKEKVKALTDNANTIYQHEMAEIQGNYFTQMCDANADYINKQYRLLGQKATNRTISDINSRIAPQIQLLEKRQRDDVVRYNQGNLGGTYGAIGANMNAAMAMNPKDAQELSEYRQAQEFLVDAAKISEAAQRGKGFWKGLGESLGDRDTWDFGMSQLFRSVALKNIVEKYEQGTPLTDSERALMDSAVAYMSACAYNSDKLSRLYKAGQTTGESIPFMLQFMVMPVDALKNKVAKGLLGYGIEQFGGKALQTAGEATAKYGLKTALKEAGTALVGNMAAAGVQTAAFGIPKIIEGTVSRRTGDIQPEFDEQGNIVYGGRQNQQGIVDAVWNSTVDMYVENLSEMILTSLDPIKAYMGASRLFSGLKNSEIAQVLGRLNDGVIGKIRNRVQFRNYIEEVSEEYVGNLMRWGLSSDVNSADEAGFSVDQQIDTWLGLAPTSIAFGIANAAEGGIASFQSSAAARKLRSIMEDGEQRKYFEQLLASNNSDEFAQNTHNVVKSILRDDTLNEETKRNALNVIYAAYQSQLAQEVEQVHNTELDKQQEQPEVATISKEQKEGEEQYTDKDGEVVVFYRNSDGSVTLRDEDGNTIVDEQGSAVVMSENEFNKFVVDNNLTRLDDEQSALKRREDELRQHWEQIWQPRTHSDGNVYRVRLASDEMREGYIIGDGKVEIDRTDSENPHISNSDIVTVRYDDGTMEQLPAKDLDLLQAASAYDMVENTMQPFYEYAQAMQVFHIGQEVSMESEDGNTYTSRVVNISEEGVEVEIENPQGEADTTIIPNTVALSVLRPIEQQTEQSVGDITNPQPIGTNRFGNVYQWVVGKAKEAAQFLRKHKNSYLKGVFHRDEIGDIDLVWGNDKAGLQHIIRRHIEEQDDFDGINEAIEAIEQTIKNGSIVSANGSQCTIDDGIYRVAIAKDETGNWVITAYDNSRKKEEKQRSSDNSPLVVPSTERNTPSDVAFSHQENNTTSNGKGTTNNLVAQTPDINTMDADMLGATTVEYLGGDKATAKAYLEAERDKAKAEVKRLSSQKVKKYADIADFKRQNDELNAQKKASIDRLNKLEQAIITANHYKTDAEQQAEAERKAREAAIRAERRQTATTKTSNSTPAERWNSAPKVIGNTITRTLPDGTIIRGHYVLAEANTATPSHDPLNGWNTSIGFPVTEDGKNINDRDYKHDKDAQQITQQIAQTYDGQAVAQVPVVSSEGIVYDGNGRTIAGNIAAANNTDGAYIQALVGNASNFGFTAEQVAQMQHPRVYMQLDEDLPYNTTTFAKFNVQEKKTQSSTSRAVSNSKKMTEAVRDSILEIMNDYSTLESFFASETGAKNIIKVLLDNGIMTQQEVAGLTEVTDRGYLFSPTGKDYITDLLIGSLFDEDAIRMLGNDKGLKQSILRALPSIVENRRLGDYALTDSINSAIQLLYEARQAGTAYALYIRQGNAFEGYVSDRFSPFDMLLAEEMSAGVEKFRDVLELYNKTAQDESHGQTGLFGVRTIEDIKNEILQHYGKSRGQTATTEQGTERPANTQTQPPVSSTQTGDGRTKVAADIPTSKILEQIEAEAEPFEEIELTPDNWYALFGADGIVSTPIGYVKMGEHQYLKLAQKGRDGKLGMIKPTLEHPSVVVMDKSQAKDGQNTEREFSYVFVKAFVGKDGKRVYYFTSVTVSKDGQEVVISNQEKTANKITKLIQQGKLVWLNNSSLHPTSQVKESVPFNRSRKPTNTDNQPAVLGINPSEKSSDKSTKESANDQTKSQKSVEKQQTVSTTEQSEAQQSPNKIFTDDLYAAARQRIQARLNRLNAGLDPEMLSDGLIVAGYYVEKGARKFAEYTKEMVRDFGDKIRPYLKAFYNGLRDLPEATELSKEMDDYATVAAFDVNSVLLDEQEENVDNVWKKEEENIPLRPSKVDVDGVFGALNAKGEARLSDHIEQESLSSANAEDTQPIGNVTQSKHTKTGEDIWIVKPSERVGDAEFKQLKERAKAYSGYYSSFAKNRGFIFKSQDDANNFNRIGTDEGVSTQLEESQPKLATRGATKQEIAQHIKEQNDRKKKEIARKQNEQPMLGLVGDVTDTLNDGVQQEAEKKFAKHVDEVQLETEYQAAVDKEWDVELEWQEKILDYVFEHYPTQAVLSAKSASEQGLREREAMRKDPMLKKMLEEADSATNEAGEASSAALARLEEAEAGRKPRYQKAEAKARADKREGALRDALVERLREGGMEVITDVRDGQRVLDEVNGKARQMSFGELYDYEAYPLGRVEPNLSERSVELVDANANHGFTNYKEAKAWAKQNITKTYNNEETGGKGDVRISNAAIDKFLSQNAVGKSNSKDVHMAVLKVLPKVLKTSIDIETHPDFLKGADGKRKTENGINKDVLVHRCYGAVSIDGKPYRVKITLKEEVRNKNLPHNAHSYEATKIELLEGTLVKPKGDNPNTNNSISAAKLLEKVGMSYNPSEKVLDASEKRSKDIREQRVYHGSGADFTEFDHSHMGEGEGAQAYGWGTYVTEVESIGKAYAEASIKRNGVAFNLNTELESAIESLRNNRDSLKRCKELLPEVEKNRNKVEKKLNEFNREAERLKNEYGEHSIEYQNYIFYDIYSDELNKTKGSLERLQSDIEYYEKNIPELERKVDDLNHQIGDLKLRNIYTVEIPDDNGSNYLEWTGRPIFIANKIAKKIVESDINMAIDFLEQNHTSFSLSDIDALRNRKDEIDKERIVNMIAKDIAELSNRYIYKDLESLLGSSKAASGFLSECGVVGIKYPAQFMSGGREDGASNYVIFNEADVRITDHVRFFRTANGEAYGYTLGNKIYIDPRIANSETPIHEYAHLWATALRNGNEKEWRNVVELMRGTRVWDEVRTHYPELEREDDIADEVLATYSGRRGAERLRKEMEVADGIAKNALERVKQALQKFWKGVADMLHVHYTSAEEVADRVMKDLLNEVDPRKSQNPNSDIRFRKGSEEEAIRSKAKADGTFMYAPNGKPTNLTERQWLQVRTQAFKGWFGDWEKAARIEKLKYSNEVDVKYHGEYSLTAKDAQEWIKENLRGEYKINDTNEIVQLSKVGADEVTSHSRLDEAHLKSISAIPDMLNNAIFITEEPNTKNNGKFDSYRYYVVGLNIDDVPYTAKIVIGVKQGKKYYDHRLTKIEKSRLIDNINQPTLGFTTEGNTSLPPYANGKDTKLISILQTNSSKVVDENGEPRVVYHQTNAKELVNVETMETWDDLDMFEKAEWQNRDDFDNYWVGRDFHTFNNKNGRYSIEMPAFFFSPEYDEYHEYGDRTITAFLNIRNPKINPDIPNRGVTDTAGEDAMNALIEQGYDGFIREYDGVIEEINAFFPNQIKSATDNVGTFNSANDDIRFSMLRTKKMQAELAEKEAKYANQSHNSVNLDKMDSEDDATDTAEAQYDELDYDIDNLTDAQQLATDAVLGALDDAGISVERVSEEEAEREVEKEKSESSVRLIRQMAEGTKGQSNNPITGAKVQKNLEDAKEKYKKYGISTENAITDISKALGARNTGTSNYITIEAKNGTIFTLRLSNHNATVANFDNNGETNGISIVISRHDNKGITNNGDAHIVEFFYSDKSLNKADGTPIADIIGALEQTMYSGEYTDPTGLAQRQEVNIPAELHSAEFSIRQTPAPKNTGIGYKVFYRGKDGKLYPPMVANPNGADTPIGVWLNADAAPISGESKTGRPQVKAGGKGTQGGSGQLAYRPGWHLREIPYALQFNRKDENEDKTLFPKDFVWAEVEYAADVNYQQEAEKEGITENGKYRHSYAGLKHLPTDGYYRYRTNPNPETDPWIITGAMKVNRVLTNEEVDDLVRKAGREPQQREFLRTSNGTIYGYAKDGKIYLTDRGFNPNTPIHEYTHLWVKAVRNNNTELYDNLRNLFSRENLPDMWNELDRDPQYSNLSDEAKLSEIIARFSGKRGAERMEQEAQRLTDEARSKGKRALADAVSLGNRMRDMLKRFWNWVGENLFGIKNFGSREEAADRVLYDMLNGTDLRMDTSLEDGKTEFDISPMPKRIDGEKVYEWAKRVAEWKRQQVDEKELAEYKKLMEHNRGNASQAYKYIVDKFTAIENLQEWIQKRGGVFDPKTMDMHSDLSMALGRISTYSRRYKEEYIQRIADSISAIINNKELTEALKGLGLKWQNFDNKKVNGKPLTIREIMGVYAQARDTKEAEEMGLADRGAKGFINNLGMGYEDVIESVEGVIPQEQIDSFWDSVYAANQFALDYQLNAGLIDEDTRNHYTRRYYVPQRGWRERDFEGIDTSYAKDYGNRLYGNPYNTALVKAYGRESLASDPFALIESIGLTSIRQAEHNKSKQALLNLLLANEELGLKSGAWCIKQIWSKNVIDPNTGHIMLKPDGTPIPAEITYAAPTRQERAHDADINAEIDQLRKKHSKTKNPAARVEIEEKIADLQDQLIYTGRATDTMIEHRTRDERMQHQVVVIKDGKQYIIELQDEELTNAVNGNFGEAIKGYKMLNRINTPAIRYISGILTQYNPRFAHRNFWRDAQQAFLNNINEQGVKFTTHAMANIPAVQRTIWQYILSDSYHSKESFGGKFGGYLREYFEAGAQTGFSFMPELERMAKDFDKMVEGESILDKVWERGVKGTLSLITEASELTVRFAEYVTARQLGQSVTEAAKLAKNITVNFNQSGLISKEMSKFFTFFNATIQGNMRFLIPSGKNKPKPGAKALRFGSRFAGMAANFILLGLLNTWLQPDDPDDDTWFTEYDRMTYFIIGGKLKIPVVHFFRAFYAAGVQAALAAQGRKTWKDAFFTASDYTLGELIPTSALQFQNMFDYDDTTNTLEFNLSKYAQAAAPSIFSPLVDVAVNQDFKGSTIYRKKWDEDKKNITTTKRNTPQWAIDASNTLHRWSGGDPEVPYKGGKTDGWIDIKPNAIEHIAQGYLSGVWESIGHTAGFVYDIAKGGDEYKSATNWPFVRDLLRDYSEEKAYNSVYYSVSQKLDKYSKRINTYSDEEWKEEKTSNRFKTYKEVCKKLNKMPVPYEDGEEGASASDVKDILQLDIQLNRNLFK